MSQVHEAPRLRTPGPRTEIGDATRFLVPLGRLLFSAIFLMSAAGHFSADLIERAAAHGVPLPMIAVPLSGVIAIVGGLSILLGCYARVGAWLIVLFLVPVTLQMHNFWVQDDAGHTQMIMVLKNASMLGGALLIVHFGAGPVSIDAWTEHKK